MADPRILCGLLASIVVSCLLLVYSAWSVLEPWEFGLDYSSITQTISPEAWSVGRHYIGVGHKFLRFNSTVTTVQFVKDGRINTALRSRTADGLELTLEISFQYQLVADTLYKMYTNYGPDYHDTFVKMGMDLLTMAATKHDARAFFVNRTQIGQTMEESLKSHFRERAYVEVPLFQFQAVELPPEFEAAIKATQVAEQKIKRVKAEQNMKRVEYETTVLQAQRYVQVRQQQAAAIAESTRLRNDAEIASFNASQTMTAKAFKEILDAFGGETDKLLNYMKVRAMRDHPSSHAILGIRDDADVQRRLLPRSGSSGVASLDL